MLEIFAGSIKTGENDNWGGSPSLAASLANVGAFPYSSPLSKDSASVIATASRDNSIRVSSTDRGTGQVIAEIYDATPPANFTSATPRLLNVSVLKSLGTGLTVGFTLAGSSAKTVLIRAIGPTLTVFGVTGVLADPQLRLFNSTGTQINLNDDWGGTAALSSAFTSVGAFALGATSKDAALVVSLAPGSYTAQVSGIGGTTGVALVEVYELP